MRSPILSNRGVTYLSELLNVILKIVPDERLGFVAQTAPGLVFSGTDFCYSENGIMASETTLDEIDTYNEKGVPIFQGLRLAIQNSRFFDEFSKRIVQDNTGGYVNDYPMADG